MAELNEGGGLAHAGHAGISKHTGIAELRAAAPAAVPALLSKALDFLAGRAELHRMLFHAEKVADSISELPKQINAYICIATAGRELGNKDYPRYILDKAFQRYEQSDDLVGVTDRLATRFAIALLEVGDFEGATKILGAPRSDEQRVKQSFLFAKHHLLANQKEKAGELIQAALEISDRPHASHEIKSSVLVETASALFQIGDFASAKSMLSGISDCALKSTLAHSLALRCVRNGRFMLALSLCDHISDFTSCVDAYMTVSRLRLEMGDAASALKALEQKLKSLSSTGLKKMDGTIHSAIAAAQTILGDPKSGHATLDNALKIASQFDGRSVMADIPAVAAMLGNTGHALYLAEKLYTEKAHVYWSRKVVDGWTPNKHMYKRALIGVGLGCLESGNIKGAYHALEKYRAFTGIGSDESKPPQQDEIAAIPHVLKELFYKDFQGHADAVRRIALGFVRRGDLQRGIAIAKVFGQQNSAALINDITESYLDSRLDLPLRIPPSESNEVSEFILQEIDRVLYREYEKRPERKVAAIVERSALDIGDVEPPLKIKRPLRLETFLAALVCDPLSQNALARVEKRLGVKLTVSPEERVAATVSQIRTATNHSRLDTSEQEFLSHVILALEQDPSLLGLGKRLARHIGLIGRLNDIERTERLFPDEKRLLAGAIMRKAFAVTKARFNRDDAKALVSRTKADITRVLESKFKERGIFKCLCDTLVALDIKESSDFLLEALRKKLSTHNPSQISKQSPKHLRLLKLLAEWNTFHGNTLTVSFLTHPELDDRLSRYFISKLFSNNYLDSTAKDWLEQRSNPLTFGATPFQSLNCSDDMQIIRKLLARNIMPSKLILGFLVDEKWSDSKGKEISSLDKRLDTLASYKDDFAAARDGDVLISILANAPKKAMAYYLLYSGNTRFSLINNYTFDKFSDVISIAARLTRHPKPLKTFEAALSQAGLPAEHVRSVMTNLEDGHHPFYSATNPSLQRQIRLDLSDTSKIELANREAGIVIARQQLGACLKAPLYREYLMAESLNLAQRRKRDLLIYLNSAKTLVERENALLRIEVDHPEYLERAESALKEIWAELGEKIAFTTTLGNILKNDSNTVDCVDLIQEIERGRISLKRAKAEHILALRGENPLIKKIGEDIRKKEKALTNLSAGLAKNPHLKNAISDLQREVQDLKERREALGLNLVSDRYAHLDPTERKLLITEEAAKLKALTEKNPAAIFTCLVMETVGEKRLTEDDTELIKEVASHLEHPFQMVSDLAKLDSHGRRNEKERPVLIKYLDKKEDLMTLVRFADSKICCFSSSNYEMRVGHQTPNKFWLASIIRDPLSFVFEIQAVRSEDNTESKVVDNMGFVFGMYGITSDNKPAVFLNGVYLSNGNDKTSVLSVLNAIEDLLSRRLHAAVQVVGSMHGGRVGETLPGYSTEMVEGTRLRALTNSHREVETAIYDDLGTIINREDIFRGIHKVL